MILTLAYLMEILNKVHYEYNDNFDVYCKEYVRAEKQKLLMLDQKISADAFLSIIKANVNNEKMTDSDFRNLIKNTLPIIRVDESKQTEKIIKEHQKS